MRTYSLSAKPRALCCGKKHHHHPSCRVCRNQRNRQQRRELVHMSHKERLELSSSHILWGHGCILSGILLLAAVAIVAPRVSWAAMEDSSAALIAWLLGTGLGSSLVLVFFESSRHLKTASKIKNVDEELLETWTISLESDDQEDELLSESSDNESENAESRRDSGDVGEQP